MDSKADDPYLLRQIPQDHLISVCKYRQGETCCKYIFFPRDRNDFYCAKKIEEIKNYLDAEPMVAKGDNCQGLPNA